MRFILTMAVVMWFFCCTAQDYEVVGYTKKDSVDAANSPVVNKTAPSTQAFKIPGLRMRNTGRTLTILGGAMLIGGIIVFNSADEKYYNTYQTNQGTYTEGDPRAAWGTLMMTGGVGMAVPGVILWSKGAKKYNRYLEKQSVSFNHSASSISLSYNF